MDRSGAGEALPSYCGLGAGWPFVSSTNQIPGNRQWQRDGGLGAEQQARRLTQVSTVEVLGANQGRISDLTRGKVEKVSLDMLVTFAAKLGKPARTSWPLLETLRLARANGRIADLTSISSGVHNIWIVIFAGSRPLGVVAEQHASVSRKPLKLSH